MKFNKWTLGLAALGVVSLASAAKADEKSAPTYLETAVSGTTISGYVNTSAHWDLGSGNNNNPGYSYNGGTSKGDGFNLDAVELTLSKPVDETDWGSGYTAQLVYGQDSAGVGLTTSSNGAPAAAIKQAYVELRSPIGNGIDWKMGVFDTIVGYEVFDAGSNPNYTRSYGYTIEPTTHTGVLAAYKFADWISVQAGIANTRNSSLLNDRTQNADGTVAESRKTYMGSVALVAPNSWGWMAGSTLYGAVIKGGVAGGNGQYANYYVGAQLNSPIKDLKFGASYDYVGDVNNAGTSQWADAVAFYTSYKLSDNMSIHGRAEYFWQKAKFGAPLSGTGNVTGVSQSSDYALTGTLQYDLWKNVLSRLEIRWDHAAGTNPGNEFGKNAADANHLLVAANVIYKF